MKWNSRGNTCLLLTSTDVDKTGQSYYGETSIYCLDTKGATAHLQPGGSRAGGGLGGGGRVQVSAGVRVTGQPVR